MFVESWLLRDQLKVGHEKRKSSHSRESSLSLVLDEIYMLRRLSLSFIFLQNNYRGCIDCTCQKKLQKEILLSS